MLSSDKTTLHNRQAASSNTGGSNTINNNLSWVKVVSRRGRNTTSFRKTVTQPRQVQNERNELTPLASSQSADHIGSSTNATAVELSNKVEVIRPFLKGTEDDSILVDITEVKNWDLLVQSLNSFNDINKGQHEYIGRVGKVHKYLQRAYMETIWARSSSGEKAILEGYLLSDGTFIKGFRSFHHEAEIVKVKLEKLPFLQEDELKEQMESVLQRYGKILDLGIYRTSAGCYMGHGYATLDTSPTSDQEVSFLPLEHVITWIDGTRIVHLQYDNMPPFCRLCHKNDHCRADCPEYKKYFTCHNCNEKGHVQKNCRYSQGNVEIVSVQNKKQKVVNSLKNNRKSSANRSESTDDSERNIQRETKPLPPLSISDFIPPTLTQAMGKDTMEVDSESTVSIPASSDPLPLAEVLADSPIETAPMESLGRRGSLSPPPRVSSKFSKTHDTTDVSSSRNQHNSPEYTTILRMPALPADDDEDLPMVSSSQ